MRFTTQQAKKEEAERWAETSLMQCQVKEAYLSYVSDKEPFGISRKSVACQKDSSGDSVRGGSERKDWNRKANQAGFPELKSEKELALTQA